MEEESYEPPSITVLGDITDLTQKHGSHTDFPGASAQNKYKNPTGSPGWATS
jgi:hypothetical protein